MLFQVKRAVWISALMKGVPVYPLNYSTYRTYEVYLRQTKKKDRKPIYDYALPTDIQGALRESWWSYYGGKPMPCSECVERFIADINGGAKIDWDKMEEMREDAESEFSGTFDDVRKIPIVCGVLKMTNGNNYTWVANYEGNLSGIRSILEQIAMRESKSDEEILLEVARLLKRKV